jgi:hypothetical protein
MDIQLSLSQKTGFSNSLNYFVCKPILLQDAAFRHNNIDRVHFLAKIKEYEELNQWHQLLA